MKIKNGWNIINRRYIVIGRKIKLDNTAYRTKVVFGWNFYNEIQLRCSGKMIDFVWLGLSVIEYHVMELWPKTNLNILP
jgi:hypothetical protein